MELAKGILTIPGFLTPEECRTYIEFTESQGYEAATITTVRGFEMRPDIRNNTRVIVDDPDRAAALWARAREHVPTFLLGRQVVGLNERFRFYRYDPGERFKPHRDGRFRRDNGEESLLTFMVYLNDGFTGGRTIFEEASVEPEEGMALIFEHHLLHEGAEVHAGRKYVLRSDIMYGKFGQVRG